MKSCGIAAGLWEGLACRGFGRVVELVLRGERPFLRVLAVLRVDRHDPLRRQKLIERLFVERTRLAIHGDEECLVAERLYILAEMLRDKSGNLRDVIVGLEKRLQVHRAVEHAVEFLDVAHALGLGEREKLGFEQFRRQRHLPRHELMSQLHRRAVGDRLRDGVFVEVAALILGAEDLERALAVGGLVDRRAGEADELRVRQRAEQVVAEITARRAMRLVDQHDNVRPCAEVLVRTIELVDHCHDQPAEISREQLAQARLAIRALDLDVAAMQVTEQRVHPAGELAFKLVAIDDKQHGGVGEALLPFEDELRRRDHRERLAGPLRMPDEAGLFRRVGRASDDLLDRACLVLAQDALFQLVVLAVEDDPPL